MKNGEPGRPVVAIVGAGTGLSAAIARRFEREGFAVALVSRTIRADEPDRPAIRHFIGDAADESLFATFDAIRGWAGDPDVLVYNAAALVSDTASAISPSEMLAGMEVNLCGAMRAVAAVLPAMKARRAGAILATGGGLALEPYPDWTALACGKAALRAYVLALHKELAPTGIHAAVVAVCGIVEPGGVFDPDRIAELYWALHAEPSGGFSREVVYLPAGADPFYNDPEGRYRDNSLPIVPSGPKLSP